jgi:hypothetical protein
MNPLRFTTVGQKNEKAGAVAFRGIGSGTGRE